MVVDFSYQSLPSYTKTGTVSLEESGMGDAVKKQLKKLFSKENITDLRVFYLLLCLGLYTSEFHYFPV